MTRVSPRRPICSVISLRPPESLIVMLPSNEPSIPLRLPLHQQAVCA
jgi:hypothetical protein